MHHASCAHACCCMHAARFLPAGLPALGVRLPGRACVLAKHTDGSLRTCVHVVGHMNDVVCTSRALGRTDKVYVCVITIARTCEGPHMCKL